MSRIHRRLAPSYRTILAAACLTAVSAPAFAADTVLNIPAGPTSFSVIASPAAGDTYTVNNLGAIGFDFLGFGAVNVQGSGAGTVVINNDGRLLGPLNFTAATGSVTLHRILVHVVAETTDWTRLTPEALQAWRDRLAALSTHERGEIIN